jgi:hypothetical protein
MMVVTMIASKDIIARQMRSSQTGYSDTNYGKPLVNVPIVYEDDYFAIGKFKCMDVMNACMWKLFSLGIQSTGSSTIGMSSLFDIL